ncbi:MAG: hypothetical protein NT085_00235 [candidate division SR1 bacterium]|nr:hypothetical protein [candidate division SR1 bacterium]
MKNKKVLVADRSETCNMLVEYYLKTAGVDKNNITLVNDGVQALEVAKKELFDLIILSPYKLGMDAVELATEIKSQHKENPPKIIEFTSGAVGYKPQAVFDTFIFKPTTAEIFSERLSEVLGSDEEKE